MNIETIAMSQREARQQFLDYRNNIKDRHNEEDRAVMDGYRHLARGSALLDLRSAMRAGGQDDKSRPKIAITRADFKWCWFEYTDTGARFVGTNKDGRDSWGVKSHTYNTVRMPDAVLVRPETWQRRNDARARALVPMIPPKFRPTAKLSNYHIMFEAEWRPVPPVDPFLLKYLGGTLYVVLAHWDLTPLEQAVLAGRLEQ